MCRSHLLLASNGLPALEHPRRRLIALLPPTHTQSPPSCTSRRAKFGLLDPRGGLPWKLQSLVAFSPETCISPSGIVPGPLQRLAVPTKSPEVLRQSFCAQNALIALACLTSTCQKRTWKSLRTQASSSRILPQVSRPLPLPVPGKASALAEIFADISAWMPVAMFWWLFHA